MKILKIYEKKMSVRVNIRMSKITCTQIKVEIHIYVTYANCQTLIGPGHFPQYKIFYGLLDMDICVNFSEVKTLTYYPYLNLQIGYPNSVSHHVLS